MRRLIVTDRAFADLAEVWAYVARDSPEAATRLLERIDAVVQRLASFPLLGELDPRFGEGGYRRLVVGSYLVVYVTDEEVVRVMRVYHAARRIEDLPLSDP